MNILALETSGVTCSAALMVGTHVEQRLEQAPRKHADLILGMLDDLLKTAGLRLIDLDAIVYGRGPGSFTGVRIAAAVAQGIAFGAERPVIGISTLEATAIAAIRQTGQRRIACALDARMDEVYWGCFQATPTLAAALTRGVTPEPGVQRAMHSNTDAESRPEARSNPFDPPETAEHAQAEPLLQVLNEEHVVAPNATPPLSEIGLGHQDAQARWCAAGDGWAAYPALRERHAAQTTHWLTEIRGDARDLLEWARLSSGMSAKGKARTALPVYLRNQVATRAMAKPV
jgi:tRNA threonylcarbamoyl adenosine modification protein YeaZ